MPNTLDNKIEEPARQLFEKLALNPTMEQWVDCCKEISQFAIQKDREDLREKFDDCHCEQCVEFRNHALDIVFETPPTTDNENYVAEGKYRFTPLNHEIMGIMIDIGAFYRNETKDCIDPTTACKKIDDLIRQSHADLARTI